MKVLTFKKQVYWGAIAVMLVAAILLVIFIGGNRLEDTAAPVAAKKPVYSVNTKEKKIAFSFDAAWGADKTDSIMDILSANGANATFFLVGFWAEKYPEKVKAIHGNGFELGNHSANHPKMSKLGPADQQREIESVNDKLLALTGQKPKFFRPPFGDYNDALLDTVTAQEMLCIQWSVDSLDWKEEGVQPLVDRVLKNTQPGSIVLFHNNAKYIVDALPTILKELKKKGYSIVSIGELVYSENYIIDSQGVQHKK